VFKEAMQKMPKQFAPQSLYNMMGKSCCCCFEVHTIEQSVELRMNFFYFLSTMGKLDAAPHSVFV